MTASAVVRSDPIRPPRRGATAVDVARSAGVSAQTVSNAFNHPELVADRTRRAVLGAALRLHYRPSLAARDVRGTRGGCGIRLLLPSLQQQRYRDIAQALSAAAWRAGFVLQITTGSALPGSSAGAIGSRGTIAVRADSAWVDVRLPDGRCSTSALELDGTAADQSAAEALIASIAFASVCAESVS